MNNFIFQNSTKVYFGKGCVKEYLACLTKDARTILLAYGGGSIKRNGVYDEITGILKEAGKVIVEFPGIMPNPTYAKVQEGAKLARDYPALNPRFALMDPIYTFSVPEKQMVFGSFDILSHIMETYFSEPNEDNVSDDHEHLRYGSQQPDGKSGGF